MTPDGKGLNWQWISYIFGVIIAFLLVYMVIPLLRADRSAAIYEAKHESIKEFTDWKDKLLEGQSAIKQQNAVIVENQKRVMGKVDMLSDCFPRVEERLKAVETELRTHEEKTEGRGK